MLLKVQVQFEVVEGVFTVNVGSSHDQFIMKFTNDTKNVAEEVFDVLGTETLQISVLSHDANTSEVEHLDISLKDILSIREFPFEKDNQYKIKLTLTPIDRVPSDWFENGISLLAIEQKPWYLTAEDVYKFTKDVMHQVTTNIAAKISLPSTYIDEVLLRVDMVTAKVAQNLLHIQLTEGFSCVAKIDELIEQVLSNTDEHVDEYRIKLALKLQLLRKNLTAHLEDCSKKLTSQVDLYRGVLATNKDSLDKSLATVYTWAEDTSENTSKFAQAEHQSIVNKIDALRLSGRQVLEQTQSRVLETRDHVVNSVTDTSHQVLESVQSKLTAAQETLLVQLPQVAHPYVINAVSVSKPYVETAVTTATPFVQSLLEKSHVKNLENWIMDKKKDKLLALLEENKDTAAGVMVTNLLNQASQVITEVSEYCLNDDYFARNKQQQEEKQEEKAVVEVAEEVAEEFKQ